MAANPLVQLHSLGQSFWWDTLSRAGLRDGTVARMRDENGMRGITSNPAIFQKALSGTGDYDEDIARLGAKGLDVESIFWCLAVDDIREACDQLQPVHSSSDGADGFVSLEVDPRLAHDTDRTLREARRLWGEVDRRNLMIKIPGTPEGVQAVRRALFEGIHVNVTLLFATAAHEAVMLAHAEALEQRMEAGLAVDNVDSVASFFVSRVDTAVDPVLEAAGGAALSLQGQAAVANARLAYAQFEEFVASARWQRLADAGARVQRPLWASTSTKNPDYSDTLYVSELIGRNTVNTMPTNTVEAWRDHGEAAADTVAHDVESARSLLRALADHGVDFEAHTNQLLVEGVQQFEDAFGTLMDELQQKVPGAARQSRA
jgi:transaldolase